MKTLGKILRFLLFLVIISVFCFAFAAIALCDFDGSTYTDNAFSNDFLICIVFEVLCLAGSIFFILAYDTAYNEDDPKKGFFHKLFLILGLLITLLGGALAQAQYIGNFENAQKYSPWQVATAAPALMAQLLTLVLLEAKVKDCKWILKFLLPIASFMVCYLVYVALCYIGGSSIFVYGGIGIIICVGLLVAYVVVRRKGMPVVQRPVKQRPAKQKPAKQKPANKPANSSSGIDGGDWHAIKAFFKRGDMLAYYDRIGKYGSSISALPEGVSVKSYDVQIDERGFKCYVIVTLDVSKLNEKHTRQVLDSSYIDYDSVERDIKDARRDTYVWFTSMVDSLPQKYKSKIKFSLTIKEIS